MHYRFLGKTGLCVSVIGVGTWQFGGEWGHDFTQTEVDAILDAAGAAGINFIDTAECYGDHLAERLVGDFLARRDRSRWLVATKFGHGYKGFLDRDEVFSSDAVRGQLEASLRVLRTETIDLYQFHSGPDELFLNEELWAMLSEQKRLGKIRHLGVSIPGRGSELQAREAARLGGEALQVVYNRLDRRSEELCFPHARRDRLGVIGRVPLASGLLTGKYKPGATFPANDVRATFSLERITTHLAEAGRIQKTEVPPGMPLSQWALAWCLKEPVVSTVVAGCKNPDQVRANAHAADFVTAAAVGGG